MGPKNRYIALILFFIHAALNAQEKWDYNYVDSLTYSYYNNHEWNKLISLGQSATGKNIDYKFLRQRIGYAFFALGDYYSAGYQFEKALKFDSYDQFSLEYLYCSLLNTGHEENAGVLAPRLSSELRKLLLIREFKIPESIDLEYNFKYAGAATRSNPQYYRLGIDMKLGYRFSLYQSYSIYNQVITVIQKGKIVETRDHQPEYYALLNFNASDQLMVRTAYHFIHTTSGASVTNENFLLLAATKDLNRFSVGMNGSVLSSGQDYIYQSGFSTGYTFPGRSGFYIKGTLSGMIHNSDKSVIYNQKAGLKMMKMLWLEGNVTTGRMTGYNDYDGLYVYNSYDPMTFRSGVTLFLQMNAKVSFWVNFSYESKEFLENSSVHYNQFSYLGGIKWKL
jgi:hypothetical protein